MQIAAGGWVDETLRNWGEWKRGIVFGTSRLSPMASLMQRASRRYADEEAASIIRGADLTTMQCFISLKLGLEDGVYLPIDTAIADLRNTTPAYCKAIILTYERGFSYSDVMHTLRRRKTREDYNILMDSARDAFADNYERLTRGKEISIKVLRCG